MTTRSAPCSLAATAASNAALPPPMTMTSHVSTSLRFVGLIGPGDGRLLRQRSRRHAVLLRLACALVAIGLELGLVISVDGYVEEIAVRIHCAVLRERPVCRTHLQRLFEFLQFLLDI